MKAFNTTEHYRFFIALSKLVMLGQITEQEKEVLLAKSGLSKMEDNNYKDESGAILRLVFETF